MVEEEIRVYGFPPMYVGVESCEAEYNQGLILILTTGMICPSGEKHGHDTKMTKDSALKVSEMIRKAAEALP